MIEIAVLVPVLLAVILSFLAGMAYQKLQALNWRLENDD